VSRSKKVLYAMGTIGALALSAGCSGGATPSDGGSGDAGIEPVELTVSSIFASGSTGDILINEWMENVTAASDGAITFDFYGDGTLHPAPEALTALNSGLTDITYVGNAAFANELPISNWDDNTLQTELFDLAFPNANIAGLGQAIVQYGEGNVSLPEMREKGFVPLMPMNNGPTVLSCTEPFETADDLAGRQTRVAGPIQQGEAEALGLTPVVVALNEQYEALQRGVVECVTNAAGSVTSLGIAEIAPYNAFPETGPSAGINWVISTSAWDELPEAAREIMLEERYEPMSNYGKGLLASFEEVAAQAESAGGAVIDAADLNPLIADYWASRPSPAESAPDGVEDPEAAVERMQQIASAWEDFTIDELGVPVDKDVTEVLDLGPEIIDWEPWMQAIEDQLGAE
jgi:TRAP-type C4-dicarboxylate transport system substrate-binding protein